MADQGAQGPAATVAAPAPAKLLPSPAGHVSEAEFWANDAAPAIGGPYGIPNGMMAAAAAPGSPDDVGTLFGRLDGRRGRGLALQLQRSMGNRYAASLLGRGPVVQRQNGAGGGKGGYNYNGIDVTADRAAIRSQLEKLIERGGLSEIRTWNAAFFGLSKAQKTAIAIGLKPADVEAIDAAVGETMLQLETDARTFADSMKPSAVLATTEILDASKDRIQQELDKYGIKEKDIPPEGGGGAEGAPAAYDKQVTMENREAAGNAQERARQLTKARRAADVAQKSFMALVKVPGMPDVEKEVQKQIPELNTAYKQAEETWKMSEDLFAKQAMASTAEFPVLAMYASGPDAANQLESFANQPVEQLGETIWRQARTRLENIETIREGLGGRFDPLSNPRIVQVVLAREGVTPWQKRVGQDEVAALTAKAERDQMMMATIAIGLGLIAAIPTGGASVAAAGIVTAAAVAGAALSVYNAYEHWRDYQVQSAASKTDFAKAQSISQDEPSFFWLAVDIVGAGLEIGAAALAFKNLVKVVKEARASRDVLKMAEAVESVAPAGSVSKIKATVAGELGPEAVEQLIVAEGAKFRSGDIAKIRASLEKSALEGWTEAYDVLAGERKIRPLTQEAVMEALSEFPSSNPARWPNRGAEIIEQHGVLGWNGCYDKGYIFVKPGGQAQVANIVAHEMVHAGQDVMKVELNSFWAEFEAYSAQKRMIRALDKAGVGASIGAETSWLRAAGDIEIANYIKAHYGYEIPSTLAGFGKGDQQLTRSAIEAAKRILAVPGG